MKKTDLQDQILKIVDIDQEIEGFYDHYIEILLKEGKPLCVAVKEKKVMFDLLGYFKEQEYQIYDTFSLNSQDISFLLESLEEEQVLSSHVIPTYTKLTERNLHEHQSLARIRSFLESFSISLALNEEKEFMPVQTDRYYISCINNAEVRYVQSETKTEFAEIFLYFLQNCIDLFIQKQNPYTQSSLLFQKAFLMNYPVLESAFASSLFVYEPELKFDYASEIESAYISLHCYDYIREAFAKEQGIYNINSIMTSPHLHFDYVLNQLYLQSAIVLSQDDDSLLHMEKTFYDHYQKNAEYFPYGVEKATIIQNIFNHKEEIRERFVYNKKTS